MLFVSYILFRLVFICTDVRLDSKHAASHIYTYILHVTGEIDYVSGPYSVTFPANHTRAPLDVPIIDDNLSEGIEMFTLTINSSSLPRHVNVGNLPRATVIIVDNDGNYAY